MITEDGSVRFRRETKLTRQEIKRKRIMRGKVCRAGKIRTDWISLSRVGKVREINKMREWDFSFLSKKFVTRVRKLGDFNISQFAFAQYLRAYKWIAARKSICIPARGWHFSRMGYITALNDIIMSTLTSALSLIISRRHSIPKRLKSGNYTIWSI